MVTAEKLMVPQEEVPIKETKTVVRRKSRKGAVWTVSLLMFMIFSNLFVHALVIKYNYQMKQLEKLIDARKQEMVKLRVEMADLESFDRIHEIAQRDLGMRVAESKDYFLVKAAPAIKQVPKSSIASSPQMETTGNLWSQIGNWFGEMGQTMAQGAN